MKSVMCGVVVSSSTSCFVASLPSQPRPKMIFTRRLSRELILSVVILMNSDKPLIEQEWSSVSKLAKDFIRKLL
jgi:hypothetical protein